MQVSGSPAQLRHCRQLFPLKHGKWTRGFTSISGSIYAENCRTIFAHMCCDCGHEQACLLIAPTRADDCAPAQAENTIHKSGGSCGQANRELMRGCPVERILSWRERRNHSRRAEIQTTHESHSSEAAWRAGSARAC